MARGIIPNGIVSTNRLCEVIAADANRSVEEVEFFVKSMRRMALSLVGKGYIVHLADGIVLKPIMKGAFPAKDAQFDPEVNEVVVSAMTREDAHKCTLSKAKYVNETNQEVVARGEVIKSDSQLVDVTFATWPSAGEYIFKIATRCGRGLDYSLSSVSRPILVRMA